MKVALCITAPTSLPFNGVHPLPAKFMDRPNDQFCLCDRAYCETDESVLQLIPYIVLTKPDGTIYCYTRGKEGGEARLHAKLSVGIGGHVDRAPDDGPPGLLNLLRREAAREMLEEVGLLPELDRINFCEMIVDRSDAVGRVHLGLLTVLEVPQDVELRCEDKVIEYGEFLDLEMLSAPAHFERLENWSKHVVTYLRGRKPQVGRNTTLLKQAADYFRGAAVAVIDDTAALVRLLDRIAGGKDRLNDGTKYDNPCFVNAAEDEPIFTTRAQDMLGDWNVRQWAFKYREQNATSGPDGWEWESPAKKAKFENALMVAEAMADWRFKKVAD